ncbi:tetratricopeptide repeat protein [Streptomyces sp. NBC_00838]|uniref:tetratricopeptide repeat protein n=1 Tax=Streptomyces sp. NBC_00838 TaxID=2903680 RepID=UPI00386C87C4|nr:tetratricopeptide repeat protein [Streptomyces sp. NBC_00838]
MDLSDTGDATAAWGGVANTGHLNIGTLVMHQPAPQATASWPHQVGIIPAEARFFQHRAGADRLHKRVDSGGPAVTTHLLTGMGGVGKTQLAADYARRAWAGGGSASGLDVLVWVTASSRQAVVAGYAQAGVELCRGDPNDPEAAARSFLAWLTPKLAAKPCRWLIVLDDVADPSDVRGLWPPASPHGHTLVTTRRRDAAIASGERHTIEVGLFTRAEALAYLTTSLAGHGRNESADELEALAENLGCLPLALAQAVTCIIDIGYSAAAYRGLLVDRAITLAETAPDALPDDQTSPLAAAWSLSIDRADTLRPAGLARPMLQLTALLDANGIPTSVLTSGPALAYLTTHRTRTGPPSASESAPVSSHDATRAMRALHRLSLIEHRPASPHQTVRVHQLIQRCVRDALSDIQQEAAARAASDALSVAWPDIERDSSFAAVLRANSMALADTAEAALHQPDAHPVLHRVGTSLGESGQLTAAVGYYEKLTATIDGYLGPNHHSTLTSRHEFAGWRGEGGDGAGAVEAYESLLPDRIRVLGSDHPDTLATRHNLAWWRGKTGDALGAVDAFEELLAHRLRVLGPDHPDTLNTWGNIGWWRGRTGDAPGAVAAFQHSLSGRLRVLGAEHPDTLLTRHNLAWWRGEAGHATAAIAEFEELASDVLRVMGPGHPQALATRSALANWQGEAGDPLVAATAHEILLSDALRILDPDHPRLVTIRQRLARWRGGAGDADGAVLVLEGLLSDALRRLRPDHPDIVTFCCDLAHWREIAEAQAEGRQ